MKSVSYWRNQAAPIVQKVLAETAGKPEGEIRRAIADAYPFGIREYHPYKIWCDEVARQRGKKSALGSRKPQVKGAANKADAEDPRQVRLFDLTGAGDK